MAPEGVFDLEFVDETGKLLTVPDILEDPGSADEQGQAHSVHEPGEMAERRGHVNRPSRLQTLGGPARAGQPPARKCGCALDVLRVAGGSRCEEDETDVVGVGSTRFPIDAGNCGSAVAAAEEVRPPFESLTWARSRFPRCAEHDRVAQIWRAWPAVDHLRVVELPKRVGRTAWTSRFLRHVADFAVAVDRDEAVAHSPCPYRAEWMTSHSYQLGSRMPTTSPGSTPRSTRARAHAESPAPAAVIGVGPVGVT